jgi:hypothetical protein
MFDDFDALEPVVPPAIADPFRKLAIAPRTGDVRLGGQDFVRFARAVRGGKGQKPSLDSPLSGR